MPAAGRWMRCRGCRRASRAGWTSQAWSGRCCSSAGSPTAGPVRHGSHDPANGRPLTQWATSTATAVPTQDGRLRITAQDWAPPGTRAKATAPATDLARDQVREAYRDAGPSTWNNELPADPFWKAAHPDFAAYRGEPQRQAARAAVLNDGGSVIVALPTGRGKTAVAWSKMLLSRHGRHRRGRSDRRAGPRHGAPYAGGREGTGSDTEPASTGSPTSGRWTRHQEGVARRPCAPGPSDSSTPRPRRSCRVCRLP